MVDESADRGAGPPRPARPPRCADVGAPTAGAAPQRVADLLRTFSPDTRSPARRRRPGRPDAPQSIVPLLTLPGEGTTPLDPSRIDAARLRLKTEAAESAAASRPAPPAAPAEVDPDSFDAARSRLRART
ncbi:MAG: hypothetical protein JWN65_3833, partial [Solirubrobacterales bacterium]|nr:hypothetical protein [Solirubrobacterales bacterium]